MKPQSEIICSSPSYLCSNQKRERERKDFKPSFYLITMSLGLDQVIYIIALLHSRTKGAGVGISKTKCPAIPPPSISHSLVPVLVLSRPAPCDHRQWPLEESPVGLGWPCSPFVKLTLLLLGPKVSPQIPCILGPPPVPIHRLPAESEQRSWAQAGDTHQVSITPDRNVDT